MKNNDQLGQLTSRSELRFVRTLPGPIERVWDYLTDPEKRSRWFADGPMEPRKGGKLTFKFQHNKLAPDEIPPETHKEVHETGNVMDGIVTRWEPPRVLAYTFGSTGESEVTFELTPQGKNVLLVLTHRASGEDLEFMPGFGAGWHTHLIHLVAQLEGAPRPPFWPVFVKARADYVRLIETSKFPSAK
jgi:uncharacterized protein YndB with AHSA1/START domain